jgi:asparagine synthase (glutamine-hydrolysing)
LRAVLAAGVPRRVRPDAIRQTIARSWVGGRVTPIEGVVRVLPGSVVTIDLDTMAITERRWYRPVDDIDPERARELAGAGRVAAADALETELRAAVRRRLMADVPVATMCSGGLDSSLVTALAGAERPQMAAYAATVPGDGVMDEGPWAERVARHAGVELRSAALTPESLRETLVPTVEHFEYPLVVESSLIVALVAGAARRDGVKVLLTGESADELFAGYRGMRKHEFDDFATVGKPLATTRLEVRRALRRGREALRSAPCAEADRFERDSRAAAWRAYAHHRGARRRFESALADDLSTVLPHPLNRQDKNAMQHSIETRPPFLDPGVVGLILNLPLEFRVSPEAKGIVRDLARRHLPDDVAARPKRNPASYGLSGHLREHGRPDFLQEGILRDLLEVPADAWRRRIAAAPPYPAMQLWTGEIWCRSVLEGRPRAEVDAELWAD